MDRMNNNRKAKQAQRQRRARQDLIRASRAMGTPPTSDNYLNGNSRSQFRVPTTVSFPANVIGFPDRLKTTLKYSQLNSLGPSAAPTAQVFAVNSAFDPDSSGSGHQPSFFDTYAAIYSRYYVEAFQATFEIVNESSTTPIIWSVAYSDNSSPSGTTVEQIGESKYALTGILGTSQGPSMEKITLPWMTSAQLNGQPRVIDESEESAAVTANPADVVFAYVKVAADDGSTSITARCRTVITQRVVFKDLLPYVSS